MEQFLGHLILYMSLCLVKHSLKLFKLARKQCILAGNAIKEIALQISRLSETLMNAWIRVGYNLYITVFTYLSGMI